MTSLNGYIQGLGSGAARIVRKTGKEIKLSVYDNIDRVIVFNEAGETSQKHYDGNITWNQLVENESGTSTIGGVTFTKNNDGSYTLSGTPDNVNVFKNINYSANVNKCNLIKDHVYLLPKGNTYNGEIGMGCFGDTSDHYSINGDDIFKVVSNSISQSWVRIQISRLLNVDIGTVKIYPQLFDLTEIFGSTKADEIYALEQQEAGAGVAYFRNYFPDNYYPYNSGTQTTIPSPLFPEAIEGIGFKRQDGTYTVRIDYDDGDEHYGSITASGLAYPLYEGDILDFVNGKVIRANGIVDLGTLTWVSENSAVTGLARAQGTGIKWQSIIFCENFIYSSVTSYSLVNNGEIALTNSESTPILRIRWEDWGSYSDAQIKTALDGVIAVYKLKTPTDEYITLTGDISDIGTATVTADGTLTVTYDKAEMAIRKYSPKPDWSKIGYESAPNAVIDAFNYSKQIYDTWSFTKFTSDLNLRIFPNVDISGQLGLNGMFKGCTNLINLPPLEIGTDSGTLNASEFARNSGIEEVDLTSNNLNQENNFQNGFNGCAYLKSYSITAKVSNPSYMFSGCSSLAEAPDFDTSTASAFTEMFSGCSSLAYVSDDFDTSSGTNFYRCFYNCSSLESIPLWELKNGTNLQQLFAGCSSVKNVPLFFLTAATNLTNMFQNSGSNLTELSRNNILKMLANASSYTGTKTLAAVGFTSSMYTAASWQALTNYNDFVTAGWSIGYN